MKTPDYIANRLISRRKKFEKVACPDCTTGTPTEERPWFRKNCPNCLGTGKIKEPQ